MSKLSKNIIYNLLGQGMLVILSFVAVRFVFKRLGADALGIIYFTLTLNTLLTVTLGMGISETTVREVSAHFREEPRYIHDLLRTASLFYWGAYLLFALAIYYGVPVLVERWINLKTLDPGTAIRVVRILGIASFVALPRSFYISILRGLERMEFNNLIDVATSVLQQFGTIAILVWGGGLLHVVYWMSACFGLSIMPYLFVCSHFFSLRALLPGFSSSSSVVTRNFAFTSRMALLSLLNLTHMQADKAIVSKLLPLGVFGYYTMAYNGVSRGMLIPSSIALAAFPSLSALYKKGDHAGLASQYRKLQDLVCYGFLPVIAAVPFAARPMFTLVLNAEAARMLLLPVTFLSIGFYMNGTLNVPYVFCLAAGRPEIVARSNYYALFAVLPVTALLVYEFGIAGAGFSWVFYHLFTYAYMMPRTCSECLGMPVWKWYFQVFRIFVLAGLTYGGAWVIIRCVGSSSILSLALGYVFASIAFIAVAYRLIGDELRGTLRRLTFLKPAPTNTSPLV